MLSDLYQKIENDDLAEVEYRTVETQDGPAYVFLNTGQSTNDPFLAKEPSDGEL